MLNWYPEYNRFNGGRVLKAASQWLFKKKVFWEKNLAYYKLYREGMHITGFQ